MEYFGDRDGKSKTSSAVDEKHYPELNGREEETGEGNSEASTTQADIAALAYELWEKAGYPANSQEQDWLEAERQVLELRGNRTDSKTLAAQAGSVQS